MKWYTSSLGYSYNIDCEESCRCTDGEVICLDDSASCQDECTLGNHNCNANADCEDQRNGFRCTCKIGCPIIVTGAR